MNIGNIIAINAPPLGGVFSTADLFHLVGGGTRLINMRRIRKLVKTGVISHVQRGFYVTKDFNPWVLASRLIPQGYISLDSILSERQIVGASLGHQVSVVAPVRARVLAVAGTTIRIYSIKQELMFGRFRNEAGVAVAEPEKAFLDLLYYHSHGHHFAFDPLSEIRLNKLNHAKVQRYLAKYRNPKFVKFVTGVLRAKR